MRRISALCVLAALAAACVPYHQERTALRMPRPEAQPPELSAYAAPNKDFPTVGGDILKGTSPGETAAYQATVGAPPVVEPAPPPGANPSPRP
jgi:hypothetical protein